MTQQNIIHNLAKISENCAVAGSELDEYSRLKSHVEFRDSRLGAYSYVSSFSVINKTQIGRFTSIAHGCFIGLWEHNTQVSTHSFYLYESSGGFVRGYKNYQKDVVSTHIGNDVWVGAGVSIRKGVQVGDGAIIGMGSVVLRDVEPYSIVVGNPARHLRFRFCDEDRELLQKIQWWHFPRDEIQKMVDQELFNDFETFKTYLIERDS